MAPSTPLKEHRLRGLPSSTGSPPPPSLAERSSKGLSQERVLRTLAEAAALASAVSAAGAAATLSAGADARSAASRACAAASRAAAATVYAPARRAVARGVPRAFGAAGATSAVLEASSSLVLSTSRSASIFVVGKVSFVLEQVAAALRLAWALVVDLGWGGLWLLQAVRLVAYALLLLPGFLRVGLFYFTSTRVARGVRYGPRPRNTADVYVPPGCSFTAAELAAEASAAVARATARARRTRSDGKKRDEGLEGEVPPRFAVPSPSLARPVVVYVTGGAWLIGHRAWGSLLAARLSAAAGAVVVCLDYRNFPQAGAGAAAEDVGAGIGWAVAASGVLSGATRGGSGGGGKRGRGRERRRGGAGVVVVGQSAGAHLSALAILSRCAAEEGVVLPCFTATAAAAAAADGRDGFALPPPSTGYRSASAPSSRDSSVDVDVDATADGAAAARPAPGDPKPLRRRPSLTIPLPHLPHLVPSLEDAAETLGAWDPRASSSGAPSPASAPSSTDAKAARRPSVDRPPFFDPPEWSPSGAGLYLGASPPPIPSPTSDEPSASASPSPVASPALSPSSGRGDEGAVGDVAAFVGVSGVYDVSSLAPHLAKRGLRPELLERIMSLPSSSVRPERATKGERDVPAPSWTPALSELSPTSLLVDCVRRQREDRDAASYLSSSRAKGSKRAQKQQAFSSPWSSWPTRMPPTALLHGTADACAPASDAARFVEAARAAGARDVGLRLYERDTHTSPLIENPMRGSERDTLGADLAALVVAATAGARGARDVGDASGKSGGDLSSPPSPSSTAATLLLLREQRRTRARELGGRQRLGAVDGGGSLCPGPLISAAALVCPF